jgi:hypothetical protein
MSKGYIYLFECISDNEVSYKIGFTKNKNFNKRISSLQTGNKDKIEYLLAFETSHGYKLERTIHRLFNHCRLKGEWFSLELTDVVNFINICEKLEHNFDIIKENHFLNDSI